MKKASSKAGLGIFGIILTILGLLFLLLVVVVSCTTCTLYKKARSYTSATPMDIPVAESSMEEYSNVVRKLESFHSSMTAGKKDSLSLTAEDLNILIANRPEWSEMKGKVYFSIEDGKITADTSMPLNEVPGFSGRYLNGEITIAPSIDRGILSLQLNKAVVNGKDIPPDILASINQGLEQQVQEEIRRNSELSGSFKNVESLTIKDDVIELESMGKEPPSKTKVLE